jgi:hypothetical protein
MKSTQHEADAPDDPNLACLLQLEGMAPEVEVRSDAEVGLIEVNKAINNDD